MKKALLIGGGGTLGEYTAKELLNRGYFVDIICLEDVKSDIPNLCYYKARADLEYLKNFLSERYYDGIVNFIHYTDPEVYKPVHLYLADKTDHLIFLSSYRVYGEKQIPITEEAPQLIDIIEEKDFLEKEDYAVPKSKNERFIRSLEKKNWTIVRPVISFSKRCLDIVTVSGREVFEKGKSGEVINLPIDAKNLTASLDWAGNSGKLIAHLLNNENAYGEAFTVSTGQNLTWGEVSDIYAEVLGTKFNWVDTEKYIEERNLKSWIWILIYDRLYDRKIDCSKIMKATGLNSADFKSIKEGVIIEAENIEKELKNS